MIKEVMIELLDKQGMLFLKSLVHGLLSEKDSTVFLPILQDVLLSKGPSLIEIQAEWSLELLPASCVEIPMCEVVRGIITHDGQPLSL